MNAVTISLLILIIIGLLCIVYVVIYNKFQDYIIRINECEANIDSTLRKRFDLISKSISVIETNVKDTHDVFSNITKLRNKKLTNFELDRLLVGSITEFNKYKEENPSLRKNDSFIKIEIGLNESESEIEAFRKYYNDIISDYNKLVKSFPSNIIACFSKYKFKTYFDGKDMTDDIINDFKL